MALAFVTMFASAQFMVVTTIDQPEEGADWEMSNITDNIGIGYQLNDAITLGVVKNGEDYDVWGRYKINFLYISVQAPTEDAANNLNVGVGYSLKVWNSLYLEPNYTMPLNEDSEGNREGELKIGVAYRF
mgnify:FL=1